MSLLSELFHYDSWATQQLADYCQRQSPAVLQEIVVGTDRSILHTLTHLIGSEQEYLETLIGEKILPEVRQGQIISLAEIRERSARLLQQWEEVLDRIDQIDVTIPADGAWLETPHGQTVLFLQALQHGVDHRTQICTTLATLGLQPLSIDGWSYWIANHSSAT